VLVAAIVAGARVALGVLIRHRRAKSVKDCSRGNILGSNEENGLALALDFFFLL
jgi:hypothetical protein